MSYHKDLDRPAAGLQFEPQLLLKGCKKGRTSILQWLGFWHHTLQQVTIRRILNRHIKVAAEARLIDHAAVQFGS